MSAAWAWASDCLPCKLGSWGGEGFVCSSHLVQEVAMRTVKQSSVVRETENGEEGEDEAAEFGEEDLFHQQVEVPRHMYACVHAHAHAHAHAHTYPRPCSCSFPGHHPGHRAHSRQAVGSAALPPGPACCVDLWVPA